MKSLLKILVVIGVTGLVGVLSHRLAGSYLLRANLTFAALGAGTLLFAEQLSYIAWGARGGFAKASPALAYRVLGVVMLIFAVVCLVIAGMHGAPQG